MTREHKPTLMLIVHMDQVHTGLVHKETLRQMPPHQGQRHFQHQQTKNF